MSLSRSLAVLLLGLVASTSTGAALAQTDFTVVDRLVLTIRQPENSTDERVRRIDERWMAIVEAADNQQLAVSVEGDEQLAQVLVNGTLLLEVTLDDAEANATDTAIAIAEVWGDRLLAVLEQPEVVNKLFRTANMPEQLTVAGRQYVMLDDAVADRGQFVTDGSRVADRVIFWVDSANSNSNISPSAVAVPSTDAPNQHDSGNHQPTFPSPIPEQIYVLNRFREFIPYRAI